MKIVLQKVTSAKVVIIPSQNINTIELGYVLFVGISEDDTQTDIDYLVQKISKLRIFEDENGKMNRSIQDVGGEILSISQFTLFADTKKGNRPSFTKAGQPKFAKMMYEKFNQALETLGFNVQTGEFGAYMQVDLQNDGPTTIIFDTKNK